MMKMEPVQAKQFIQSLSFDEMDATRVSTFVNKTTNNEPKCIEPLVEGV